MIGYISLGLNALVLLHVFGIRGRISSEARSVRQHVTKSLHMHRKLTNDGSQS